MVEIAQAPCLRSGIRVQRALLVATHLWGEALLARGTNNDLRGAHPWGEALFPGGARSSSAGGLGLGALFRANGVASGAGAGGQE